MQPFKISSKNELFSGLSFSLSEVNLDSSGLNLVPIIQYDDNTPNPCLIKTDILPPHDFSGILLDRKDILPPSGLGSYNSYQEVSDSSGIHSRYVLNPEARVKKMDTQDGYIGGGNQNIMQYEPVSHHWFYQVTGGAWRAFSIIDSGRLENRYEEICGNDLVDDCVAVDGGRFDVHIKERFRVAVYWSENDAAVRRVSWLYREEENRCQIPYSEIECILLEKQYETVVRQSLWHQWLKVDGITDVGVLEDQFVFHSPHTMAEYRRYAMEETLRARVVYRGVASLSHLLEKGDRDEIDHVVLVVHGIGPVCDMYGHTLVECVSAMRRTSEIMMREHSGELNKRTVVSGHTITQLGRVEYLPVCWHSSLHAHIDNQLSRLTLSSVPKLRVFTNGTLVDVLCYSSPAFCQSILTSVATEMNRLRHLFMSRHPYYEGTFSIVGHSLGAVIALDLVCLQHQSLSLNVPLTDYGVIPPLEFELGHIFALGSPISLFLTARGISFLGEDFHFSKCKGVFNIFHPFDPVAYRLEPMISQDYPTRPLLIPHHKGRKRLHLELKDNIVKVGSDLKSKLLETLKITWSSLQEFASAHTTSSINDFGEEEVMRTISKMDSDLGELDESNDGIADPGLKLGMLNGGRRVDYVLQEAPLESFNDYLFALGSHACYWESEDTVLQILKEIYLTLDTTRDRDIDKSDFQVNFQSSSNETYQSNMFHSSLPMQSSTFYSETRDNTESVLPYCHIPAPPIMPLHPSTLVKQNGPPSGILLPTLPSIQSHSFFQPADRDVEPVGDTNFGLQGGPPQVVQAPPPMEVAGPPPHLGHLPPSPYSDSAPPYMAGLSSSYYQSVQSQGPSLPESSVNFFQPQYSEWVGPADLDPYFSEAHSNGRDEGALRAEPASLESMFYQNLDSGGRGSCHGVSENVAPWEGGSGEPSGDQWEMPARTTDTHDWLGQQHAAPSLPQIGAPWRGGDLGLPTSHDSLFGSTWSGSVAGLPPSMLTSGPNYFGSQCVGDRAPSTLSSGPGYFGSQGFGDRPPSALSSGPPAVVDRSLKLSSSDSPSEDPRRTPSPIGPSFSSKSAPRAASTVFNTRPLVPQSGRLFNKRKM